mgnify:CR=1 FL=1
MNDFEKKYSDLIRSTINYILADAKANGIIFGKDELIEFLKKQASEIIIKDKTW